MKTCKITSHSCEIGAKNAPDTQFYRYVECRLLFWPNADMSIVDSVEMGRRD